MKTSLLLLATSGFLLLAPAAHLVAVEGMMGVNQEMVMSDADLINAVNHVLKSDMLFSVYNIDVKADKGVVTLSGNVDTEKAKMDIESKVLAVPGVLKVINDIKVGSSS